VPELRDQEIGRVVLQHARQQPKVVVLNEYESRLAARFLKDGIGENPVHAAIAVPVALVEAGTVESDMTERP
jgi:hypothetical protein